MRSAYRGRLSLVALDPDWSRSLPKIARYRLRLQLAQPDQGFAPGGFRGPDTPVCNATNNYVGAMVRRHLLVKGRVQGVWYRGSCADEARVLGVSGWARNLSDGRVEVVAEGEREAVDRLVEWCRQGPPSAVVTGVDEREEQPEGLSEFLVL